MLVSQTLMYVKTFGCSLLLVNCLEKVSQCRWFRVPIILSSFSLDELRMVQMKDHGSS